MAAESGQPPTTSRSIDVLRSVAGTVGGCRGARRRHPGDRPRIGSHLGLPAVAVHGEGVSEGLLDRCGVHAEGVGDLAAVDDEGFLELVLHLR